MDSLFGVIPAGGKGTRLAPYPGPKELFPIGWQPYAVNREIHRRPKVVSQYVLESMSQAGVQRVFMIVGEHKHDILRYYGSGERFGVRIAYLYQEQALGMVHAIDLAYPWTRGVRVLFGMPDSVIHPPDAFHRLLHIHTSRSAHLTLGLFTTKRPEKFGMVKVDPTGRIIAHVDKPKRTTLKLMWGFAVWEPAFTDLIHETITSRSASRGRSELILGDVIDEALTRGLQVAGYHFTDGFYIDIGTYDEIVEAQREIAKVQK